MSSEKPIRGWVILLGLLGLELGILWGQNPAYLPEGLQPEGYGCS